jgi:hypothetical protein
MNSVRTFDIIFLLFFYQFIVVTVIFSFFLFYVSVVYGKKKVAGKTNKHSRHNNRALRGPLKIRLAEASQHPSAKSSKQHSPTSIDGNIYL